MKNEFKAGDLVFEVNFIKGISLLTLKGSRFGLNPELLFTPDNSYLKTGYEQDYEELPKLLHATPENRQALVTLYGEDAVPELPLRGSELTKKLLERQKYVLCYVSDTNDGDCRENKRPALITCFEDGYFYDGKVEVTFVTTWKHAVPVDMNGNEITEIE